MTWVKDRRERPSAPRPWRRLVWSTALLVLVGIGGGALWYWHGLGPRAGGDASPLESLGDFGTVPDFALMERSERPITRTDLQGLVWISNFFYTHCPDTCPLQSARMARLQGDFADERDVRLVSISVDPEHDTPAVLRDYAQRFGADAERWLFLTGDKAAIYHLAQQGFHLSAVDPEAAPPQAPAPPPGAQSGTRRYLQSRDREARHLLSPPPFVALLRWVFVPRLAWAHAGAEHKTLLHSSRFVLVDRQARLRGYYHSDEDAAMRRLRRDVRTVLRER